MINNNDNQKLLDVNDKESQELSRKPELEKLEKQIQQLQDKQRGILLRNRLLAVKMSRRAAEKSCYEKSTMKD